MRAEILLLLLGMCLVTYIPRALPAALTQKMRFGQRFEKFLKLIPYTAMAALIFPGVLFVDAENIWIGLAGGAVAAVLAWRKSPVMVCVLAAIATDFLLYSVF
jgi:branched-subunit amino acid transport protein